MTPISRLAALTLLIATPVVGRIDLTSREPETSTFPGRQPVSLARLHERGTLRLGVQAETLAYFVHRGLPRGLEYELLGSFASRYGATIVPRVVADAGEVAALLRAGRIDVAVLPWAKEDRIDGGRRLSAYLRLTDDDSDRGIGFPETGALFVRDDSPELAEAIDGFLARASRDGTSRELYVRYYVEHQGLGIERVAGRLVPRSPRVSPWDEVIAKHAAEAGLDWRLVAALIVEESNFDPQAVSHRGAAGLMQLMPAAAAESGATNLHHPEDNIRAGIRYLRRLSSIFAASHGDDHLRTVLAAYLLGPGPVIDAQKVALEMGLDPFRWKGNLEKSLPHLQDPEWAVRIKFPGSAGPAATRYVNSIFERYLIFRGHLDEVPAKQTTASAPKERDAA